MNRHSAPSLIFDRSISAEVIPEADRASSTAMPSVESIARSPDASHHRSSGERMTPDVGNGAAQVGAPGGVAAGEQQHGKHHPSPKSGHVSLVYKEKGLLAVWSG